MAYFTLHNFPIENRTVLVRVDYNVPLEQGKVADNYKIITSLPTIHYLLQKKCRIILATHLGRPEGKFISALKTDPLAKELQKLVPKMKIIKLNDCIGSEIKTKIEKAKPNEIVMLENLRFYQGEEDDNPVFAHSLAHLAEVYMNDAFAVSHRKEASVHAITQFLPSVAGMLLEKEMTELQKALYPERPAIWILGGAKLDKVDLLQQALNVADMVLIGGALAFSFLKAKGISVGTSKTDPASVEIAKKILTQSKSKKIVLPVDIVAVERFSSSAKAQIMKYNQLRSNQMGLDIGPKTIQLFKQALLKAHTVVWNGPLGYCEWEQFSRATKEIGRFIGKIDAIAVAGGGETVQFLQKFKLAHYFTHLSTGGGASVELLSGRKLLGIVALEENHEKWRKKIKI